MALYDEKRAINGTFGEMYLEGELIREATGLKASVSLEYTDVPMCGDLAKHQKVSGITGTGSITLTKVYSRMGLLLSDMIKQGKTPSFTIISKLADPDAHGAERVVLKNCQFSTLNLIDWTSKQIGQTTENFTFTDWDYLDVIRPE